jgi:hypothetical protein
LTSVRVYIATTEGAAEVQRITEEEPNVKSVVCLDGKALALPISPDYEAFVRKPTGILERAYGHPAYRMDVSTAITEGMSWQLGALVAHALFAAGRLAQKNDQASQVVWLTGEVDRDLQVLPVEYVREKIRRSGHLLAELKAAKIPVTLGVPRRNHDELDAGWLERLDIGVKACRIVPLDSADQILDLLGLAAPCAKGPQAASARALPLVGQARPVIGVFLGLVVMGALLSAIAWWGYGLDPPGRGPPAGRGGGPTEKKGIKQYSVAAIETRAQPGSTCAAVNFRSAEAVVTEIALSNHTPITTQGAEQLCGLRYRVTNLGGKAEVWIFGARSAKGSSSLNTKILAQARLVDEDEGVLLDIRLPRRLEQPLLHRLAIVAVRNPSGDLGQRLKGFITALDGPVRPVEWNRLLAGLQQAGLEVVHLTHELDP